MAFQVSPGVNVSEIDLTTVIPAVSTSTGAFVSDFQWGPVEEITQISNEVELVAKFGKPDTNTAVKFLTASSFLAYGADLRLVRAANNTVTKNARANNSNVAIGDVQAQYIPNDEYWFNNTQGTPVTGATFAARYPGALGNSLKVSIWGSSNVDTFSSWTYAALFDRAPTTTNYIATNFKSNANDELHIVVVDEDGLFTGTANTVLEKYEGLSKASNARDESGQSLYYVDVLYRKSKYVHWLNHPTNSGSATTLNWGSAATSSLTFDQLEIDPEDTNYSFSGGITAALTDADYIRSLDLLKNTEAVDISLMFTADHSATVQLDAIQNLSESRKDCVTFISPPLADVQDASDPATAIINYRKNDLSNVSSSYGVMDSGWKYMYDKYNDLYRYVPLNGDVAGLCARTDNDRDPWFSPAGLTRGQIKNVIKLGFNPTKAQRDDLYKNGINPVVSFPGEGTLLFGDKTLLSRPSAFDRINVRRLFIVLEKSISRAARSSLFEFNDDFTRAQFVALVDPFLRNVRGRRGIYDYRVVCDTTNNTPEIIDRNEFVGDIYIKPAKSINFIQLNFVAVRTGVAFEEVVGRF